MHKYLFYRPKNDCDDSIDQLEELLENISNKHDIEYHVIDIEHMSSQQKEEFLESLRIISRREGIKVVSSGKGPLPVSRSGKLNNIPVIVRIENGKNIDVFPHVKNGKRIETIPHLKKMFMAKTPSECIIDESITEQDISRMITSYPDLIDNNLMFLDTEVEVEGGRIDAVFKNNRDEHILVEIEIEANDNAIAQVQRFKIPYSKKYNIPLDSIKLCIVCAEIGKSRITACRTAGIEVYKLNLLKLTA